MANYAKIDVNIAKEGCWEECDDFDIEVENLYAEDFMCNNRIFHRTFLCKNLSKCKRLLESLERSEDVKSTNSTGSAE